MDGTGWYGVGFDGTLAHYDKWIDAEHCGEPIMRMVYKVRRRLDRGERVKIFTARVWENPALPDDHHRARAAIETWCEKHLGQKLEVTNIKDYGMIELWDDRARHVESNTGFWA